jgi:hypothetical protein
VPVCVGTTMTMAADLWKRWQGRTRAWERRSPRERGAGRPALAALSGLLVGAIVGLCVFRYGLGRTAEVGAGSVVVAVLSGLVMAVVMAWIVLRKGW